MEAEVEAEAEAVAEAEAEVEAEVEVEAVVEAVVEAEAEAEAEAEVEAVVETGGGQRTCASTASSLDSSARASFSAAMKWEATSEAEASGMPSSWRSHMKASEAECTLLAPQSIRCCIILTAAAGLDDEASETATDSRAPAVCCSFCRSASLRAFSTCSTSSCWRRVLAMLANSSSRCVRCASARLEEAVLESSVASTDDHAKSALCSCSRCSLASNICRSAPRAGPEHSVRTDAPAVG